MGLLNSLFGCNHKHLSFPITIRGQLRSGASAARSTYVVCLECGHEFPYDWSRMRIVQEDRRAHTAASHTAAPHRAA